MKTTYRIARLEWNLLFYSPISWLLLTLFIIQIGFDFIKALKDQVNWQMWGGHVEMATEKIFSKTDQLFYNVEQHLYLYIPLMTMGLISRELQSGSIKLLQSSPVRIREMVLGKFLAIMAFWLLLIAMLAVFGLMACVSIEHIDWRLILSGLLGIYLLAAAYSAIGVFMSSLTSYQVLAAMGTLAMLALLTFVGGMWQGVPFLRDITWFLFIANRAENLLDGLISTRDLFYFLSIAVLFLGLSILTLKAGTESKSLRDRMYRYALFICVVLLTGYCVSRPVFTLYADVTDVQSNTLIKQNREIIKRIKGPIKVMAYTNLFNEKNDYGLPTNRNANLYDWSKYQRFLPDMQLAYVNYYDSMERQWLYKSFPNANLDVLAKKITAARKWDLDLFMPPAAIHQLIDLKPYGNPSVLQIKGMGDKKEFSFTYPAYSLVDDHWAPRRERNMMTAFKRLVDKPTKAAFLSGHYERAINRLGDDSYRGMANYHGDAQSSLLDIGFDVQTLSPDQALPTDLDVLVIADPVTPYTPDQLRRIGDYIATGGNLLVLGDRGKQPLLNPLLSPLGIRFMDGTLIEESKHFAPDQVFASFTRSAEKVAPEFKAYHYNDEGKDSMQICLSGAVGLTYTDKGPFNCNPVLMTNPGTTWNKQGVFKMDTGRVTYNPEHGDDHSAIPVAVALTRKYGEKEQRILVLGDADLFDNLHMIVRRGRTVEAEDLSHELFRWFTYGQYPLDMTRTAIAQKVLINRKQLGEVKAVVLWLIPAALLIFGGLFLYRRRHK